MNLVVDEGNTACKYAIFNGEHKLHFLSIEQSFSATQAQALIDAYEVNNFLLASVRKNYGADELKFCIPVLILSTASKVPVEIAYADFSKLGLDRLAAAVALKHYFPNEAALSIGLGTCIIYDFVNADGVYQGGLIAPGLQMRLDAMHHFTAKLPSIHFNEEEFPSLPAFSTASSMLSGSLYGILFELQGVIAEFKIQYPQLKVVLTGGNSLYFEKRLKESTFANPNFILEGLNIILNYNVLQ